MTTLITPTIPPRLPSGRVHVWVLDLSTLTPATLQPHLHILSTEEQSKKMASPVREHAFLATRVLMRNVLASYGDLTPAALQFSTQPSGKPFLVNGALHFNLSHSGSYAVLGVSRDIPLGVDVEIIRHRASLMDISARFFHADEIAQLQSLNSEDQTRYFFSVWTLKEAFYKGLGTGLATGLDKTAFRVVGNMIEAQSEDHERLPVNLWQFYQTQLTADIFLSIAAKQSQPLSPDLFNAAPFF